MVDAEDLALYLPHKMELKIFNTETRKEEVFRPAFDNQVKMYTCGPTVYNYAHIGNFRTYVFEDVLRRTLKFFGMQVTQVMNITDIDDKTLKGAIEKDIPLLEYTQPYKNAFFVDLQTLRIEKAEYYPSATDYIPHMIDFIRDLVEKGFAYKSKDGSVYFSLEKFPRYGRLSHLKINELKLGAGDARVASDEYDKENVGDFVLWKAYDPERDGKIFWESPFGRGRPGWHLECSTMAMEILGDSIDLHMGAVDNIFPHHENEIAQSEARSKKPFVRYWVHSEHLIVNHKKMSKSLGNFYTLRDLLEKGYSGQEIRYLLLQTHYRTQLNFTLEALEGARNSLQRINDFIVRMQEIKEDHQPHSRMCHSELQKCYQEFAIALSEDLNISVALSIIFEMMRSVNVLYDENKLSALDAAEVLFVLQQFDRVLGVLNFTSEEKIPSEVELLVERRVQARKEKNWKLSDTLRDEIKNLGYEVEDTAQGQRIKKLHN